MNFEDLRSFGMVVQHGGFTAAERAMGERKAKLSRHIQRLESDLETQLLFRSTRSLRLTEAGRAIYEQWQIVESSLEDAEAIAVEFRSRVSGDLRVSCLPGLARYLGPKFVTDFLRDYPEVRLELHVTTEKVDLINKRFDLAIMAEVNERSNPSLLTRKLGETRSILVASPAFLARHPGITLEGIKQLPTVSVGGDYLLAGWAGSWKLRNDKGASYTLRHRPVLVSNDSAMIRDAVIEGGGIGLLSLQTCETALAQGTLKQILPEWHSLWGRISILFPDNRRMSPAARAFIEHMSNSARQKIG